MNYLHRFDLEAYERVAELGVVCHRIELRDGVIVCKEKGTPYLFHQADYEKLVAAGVIDPACIALVEGRLVDVSLDHKDRVRLASIKVREVHREALKALADGAMPKPQLACPPDKPEPGTGGNR
jgi:hypothetical protein